MIRPALKWVKNTVDGRRAPERMPPVLRDLARRSVRLLHRRYLVQSIDDAISGRGSFDDVAAFLRDRAYPLRAPLVLISQVQRSGGSLLSQLFDGHPAFAAYPQELRFGFANPDQWPRLDLRADADQSFRSLFDLKMLRLTRHGYNKGGQRLFSSDENRLVERQVQRYRFVFIPRIQYLIFKQMFDDDAPQSQRDVLNGFFSAFFNAWLDYQGRLDEKKWISAFSPRLAHDDVNTAEFFSAYPDGRLIQIIRDPWSWYPSAKNHRKSVLDGKDPRALIAMWIESTESMRLNKRRYGDRVIILGFEDLVARAEPTMRALASELHVDYDPILLEPTFNGVRVQANSSFAGQLWGVSEAPLARASLLSDDERELVDRSCKSLYDDLLVQKLAVVE